MGEDVALQVPTDWEAVRKECEAGLRTHAAIAKDNGITVAALRARARYARWAVPGDGANDRRILIDRLMALLEDQIELLEKPDVKTAGEKEVALLGTIARNLEKLIALDKAEASGREAKAETEEMQQMREKLAKRIDALTKN